MLKTVFALAAAVALFLPASAAASSPDPSSPPSSPAASLATGPIAVRDSNRVVVYYQKHYQDDRTRTGYISALPLLTENTGVDVVNLAAVHMNAGALLLNDDPPSDPMYTTMWNELHQMQHAGIAVVGMIGGAQNDTWPNLQTDFDTQYPRLKQFVQTYGLDGIDLDIELDEQQQSAGLSIHTETAIKVITALRADFGPDFLITMSPVASDLGRDTGIYGVDYDDLYAAVGDDINWFNGQFYCGWGEPTTAQYNDIVDYQQSEGAGIPTSKLVMIALTNPDNCGSGWVSLPALKDTLRSLSAEYPDFGGVAGWEYFNSLPGDTAAPWKWAAEMRAAVDGGGPTPTPTPTPSASTAAPSPLASTTGTASSALASTGASLVAPVSVGALVFVLGLIGLVAARARRRKRFDANH